MQRVLFLSCFLCSFTYADTVPDKGTVACVTIPTAHYNFDGAYGERLDNNVSAWMLTAPEANPGMPEMFRMRDRQPVPQLVPWAGEFAGKYLLSAVMALRASDDPKLRPYIEVFVRDLIATQSPEGYLGPFLKERRLLGEWDLWGHYRCILVTGMGIEPMTTGLKVHRTQKRSGRNSWEFGCRTQANYEMARAIGHLRVDSDNAERPSCIPQESRWEANRDQKKVPKVDRSPSWG